MRIINSYVIFIYIIGILIFSVSINGCGKRGDPKPEGDEKPYHPKKYPTN